MLVDEEPALGLGFQQLVEALGGDRDREAVRHVAGGRRGPEARGAFAHRERGRQIRCARRGDALAGTRTDRRDELAVGDERDAVGVLVHRVQRGLEVDAQRRPDGARDGDAGERGFDGVGDRAVLRTGAVGIVQEVGDRIDRQLLEVGEEGLDDRADDGQVAGPAVTRGEGGEADVEVADLVDVDVLGIAGHGREARSRR